MFGFFAIEKFNKTGLKNPLFSLIQASEKSIFGQVPDPSLAFIAKKKKE